MQCKLNVFWCPERCNTKQIEELLSKIKIDGYYLKKAEGLLLKQVMEEVKI